MSRNINIYDDILLSNAEKILEDIGMDVNAFVKMSLKKLTKEQGISFLLNESPVFKTAELKEKENICILNEEKKTKNKMTKNKAINLLRNEGIRFNGNVTFASKNKSANNYWANPNFGVLAEQWYLILNDWISEKIYLFTIPQNVISTSELICRSDKKNLIDLQIMYDDVTFTDMRSDLSFARFLVKTIDY